jgi:hypothetical protein
VQVLGLLRRYRECRIVAVEMLHANIQLIVSFFQEDNAATS